MNARIKELIEQATTKREFYPAGCNGYPEYRYDFDQEKFAELLILECARQCDKKSGLKYSPNAASSREECKHNILTLLN